jgi:hypothetical protein
MTESQRHAVAAGFLHILHAHPEVYERWITKGDAATTAKLIQDELGLAQPPTKEDLEVMARYIDTHLKMQVEQIRAAHTNAPRHVGFFTGIMTDS